MINSEHNFGIMFHHFHGGKHPVVEGSISAEDTDRMIKFLKRDYKILSAQEWMDGYLAGNLPKNATCLTFDDGLKCQYDVCKPVLDAHGIKAFWYIYTSPLEGNLEKLELYRYFKNTKFQNSDDFYDAFYSACQSFAWAGEVVAAKATDEAKNYHKDFSFYTLNDRIFRYVRDKTLGRAKYFQVMDKMIELAKFPISGLNELLWMTKSDVRNLSDEGHLIGLHSHTHPTAMGDLTYAQQAEEYSTNKQKLEQITGKTVVTASHPSNSYSEDTLKLFEKMAIKLAFRANMKFVEGRYTIPREDHIIIHKMAQA